MEIVRHFETLKFVGIAMGYDSVEEVEEEGEEDVVSRRKEEHGLLPPVDSIERRRSEAGDFRDDTLKELRRVNQLAKKKNRTRSRRYRSSSDSEDSQVELLSV